MRNFLLLAVFLLLLAAGYFLQVSDLLTSDIETTILASECDLRQQACQIQYQGEQWQFAISPPDFTVLQPLTISLKILSESGFRPGSVKVQFEGINMDMGYNLVKLQPISDKLFQAEGMIPDCTAETMYWLVHLIISSEDKQTDFQFRIQT